MFIKKVTIFGLATLAVLTVAVGSTEAGKKGGWLGVSVETVNEDVRDDWNLTVSEGVLVTRVASGSPADDSGIKRGDVILKYEGKSVSYVDQLQKLVRKTPPEEEVKIKVTRDGKIKDFVVLVGRERRNNFVPKFRSGNHSYGFYTRNDEGGYLGIDMFNLTDGLREYFKVDEDEGVLVVNIMEDSPAEKAGFKSGDVITRVGRRIVEDSGELKKAISRHNPGEKVEIEYVRNKKKSKKTVKLGDREDFESDDFRFFGQMHNGNRGSFFFDMDDFNMDMKGFRNDLRHLKDDLEIDL